ncbi:CopD family protein [Streptomyces ficellus]|uniref:CopD family protein n=1 Tax=Streptomyces ficellus TaxID=1977088 RepID=UPI001FCBB2E3|nr:CopD family protein [Streptomyces ficellus]
MTVDTEDGAVRRSGRRRALLAAGGAVALAVAVSGAGVAARGTGELHIPAAGATTCLRVAVFAALAVHLGELAGVRLAGPGALPRALSLWAALGGAAASAGQIALLADVSGLDLTATYGTRDGGLLLAMANGFALAAGCVALGRPGWAAAPLALVVGAEAMRAHPEPYTPELGIALTVVHLTAASLWAGGLAYVLRTMRLRRGGRDALARYARLAGWLYVALAVTGTCSALRRLPADVVVTTAYGRLLLAKLALVAVASALAVTARRRLRRAGDATTPARAELAVLALVVVVSALLTVVPDPHWVSLRLGLR